jgi:carbohydrate diacid regulator
MGRFCEDLIYPGYSDLPNMEGRATMLELRFDCPRIPIMIVPHREEHQELVEMMCRESSTSQDIVVRPVGVHTVVFLRLKTVPSLCGSYKEQVEAYLTPIVSKLEKKEARCKCFVGSIQNRLDQYHISFEHCTWMARYIRSSYQPYCIAYFYDHVYEYLHSTVEHEKFAGIFEAYTQYEQETFWENFIPIAGAMRENQNNMIKSSEALHMHKNTLAYRYKQIRSELGLDPIQSTSDNYFVAELCHYLKNK